MTADEKPPAPCRVCDRNPTADDAGATWQDVVCPGCGRYRLAPLLSDAAPERVEAAKALARRERRRKA